MKDSISIKIPGDFGNIKYIHLIQPSGEPIIIWGNTTGAANTGNIKKLLNQLDDTDKQNIVSISDKLYKSRVTGTIFAYRQDLIHSDIADDLIKNAKLSDPIPMFASSTQYNKGGGL